MFPSLHSDSSVQCTSLFAKFRVYCITEAKRGKNERKERQEQRKVWVQEKHWEGIIVSKNASIKCAFLKFVKNKNEYPTFFSVFNSDSVHKAFTIFPLINCNG